MPTIFAQRPQMESALSPISLRSALACRRSLHRFSCLKFSSEVDGPFQTVGVITISYSELKDKGGDLSPKIEEGFGPNGLGIVSISGVPRFPDLRQTLLSLSSRLANLPDAVKSNLEDSDSRYNIGWSHGKEKLESGKLDTYKGSFYANPILDVPTTDASLMRRYPSYCRPNLWPADGLPELKSAFNALGKLMLDVGMMLAYHCDQYVSKEMKINEDERLKRILERSRCHKGRLLYYFPKQESESFNDSGVSSWCGWHTDHGSLTGLANGMFMKNGIRIACPDVEAGLYVRTRNNQIVRAAFGEDDLAYQIGEITEILSQAHLCATPHCVKAPNGGKAIGVERSTFALFMQPDWDEKLKFPSKILHHQELIPPNETLPFGEYSEVLLNKYYRQKP